MKKYIGCDLGGTNLRASIVDVEKGSILHQVSVPTQAQEGYQAVIERMSSVITPGDQLNRIDQGRDRWHRDRGSGHA